MRVRSTWLKDLRQTPELIDYLRPLASEVIASEAADRLLLCVVEAFNNICLHAQPVRPAERITLSLTLGTDQVSVCLEDRGGFFNPILEADLIRFTEPESLNDLQENGRGLAIILYQADKVAYVREGEINSLTLTVMNHDRPRVA